jgi:hypothetical protein
MNKKRFLLGLLVLSLCRVGFAVNPPPFPTEFFQFLPTNFITDYGSIPAAYTTNLVSTNVDLDPFYGDVVILDTTNLTPAYLEYWVSDTNWIANIEYDVGDMFFLFEPNWASVSQGGTGPGGTAYLIAGGDWTSGSPNGLFRVYIDAAGSNIFFGGIQSGVTNTYASAPISWSSNSWHEIGVSYSVGRHGQSDIYLDGGLAATGTIVSNVPVLGTNSLGFYTNTFFIGSDNNGYEQARGAFYNLDTWSGEVYGGYYTNDWLNFSNSLATWQSGLGGGFFGALFGPLGELTDLLSSGCPCTNCIFGTDLSTVYVANVWATNDANGDGNITYTFSIQGGMPEVPYDVFSAPSLTGTALTSASWVWLGQGTNCGVYQITNQPFGLSFYILGTPLPAADGSGLTQAYEALVHSSSSGGDGVSGLYKLLHGLSLSTSIAVPSLGSISIQSCPIP